jgi:DHA3 family tetracycline resistance protein-like MFS transporter
MSLTALQPAAQRIRLAEPLRHPGFLLLMTGMTVSLLGDGVFLVGLTWQVYLISNTPSALSLVGIAMFGPQVLFLLPAGAVSDRMDRRGIMLASDLVRGAVLLATGVLAVTRQLHLSHLYALGGAYGAATAFFGPAYEAAVPDLVPADLLVQANSLDQLARPLALALAGPALGGWLIGAWGVGSAFLLDAGTFAFSVAMLVAMGRSDPRQAVAAGTFRLAEIAEGFRFIRRHVWLWATFAAATVSYLLFMGPAEVLVPYLVKNSPGGTAGELGLVFAAGGVGALGAALVVGHRGMPRRHITVMYLCWAIATFSIAGYGLATAGWHLMAVSLAFHALETAGTIVWLTAKQQFVPASLLGRVSSLDWFISISLLPLSFGLAGWAAAIFGARTTLVAAGLLGGSVTLAFLFLPGMRSTQLPAQHLQPQ